MMAMTRYLAFLLVMTLTACGGGSTDPEVPKQGSAPQAVIKKTTPGKIYTQQLVEYDGSYSVYADAPIVSYQWQSGDQLQQGALASFSYPSPGTYVVSLEVTDSDGLSGQAVYYQEVYQETVGGQNQAPTAVITNPPSQVKVGQTVVFDGSNSVDPDGEVVSYQWSIEGKLYTGATASHRFDNLGQFSVSLTVTDDLGDSAVTQHSIKVVSDDVVEPLEVVISASDDVVEQGESLTFSAISGSDSITEYHWTVDGTTAGSSATLSYTFNKLGMIPVQLEVSDEQGRKASASITIEVKDKGTPAPELKLSLSPSSTQRIQTGSSLQFDASASSGAAPLGFVWDKGETTSKITRSFPNPGNFQVCVTVSDALQRSAQQCVDVQVSAPVVEPTTTVVYYRGDHTHIYYWLMQPEQAEVAWPGKMMEVLGDGWYRYDFGGLVDSGNVIFNQSGNAQTGDLTFNSATPCYQNNNWVSMAECEIQDNQAPVVEASPEAGNYAQSQLQVTLTAIDQDPNAKIYYTTDGTAPSTASALYTSPISISDKGAGVDAVIKAIGLDEAGNLSEVYSFEYRLNEDVVAPVISASPEPGHYQEPVTVTLSAMDNIDGKVDVYYTLNGEVATANSTRYSAPIHIDQTTTVNVYAVDSAGNAVFNSLRYRIGDSVARTDFREETVYFLLTTRFYDGAQQNNVNNWDDGKAGNPASDPAWRGDFTGLIEKLDYIKALGFSAIWINPPVKNVSGYDYHGYHAVNMAEIDPRFDANGDGSAMDEYQALIDAVHAKDMKIIQDVVLNHTSNFGEENLFPMFQQDSSGSYIGLSSPVYDDNTAYHDADLLTPNDFLNGVAGGNYAGLTPEQQYGKRIEAMKEDHNDTGHIYHHEKNLSWNSYQIQTGQIAGDCVDLNTENPVVIQYLIDTYNQYIDMGVDGFRVDTVKHIPRLMFNEYFVPAFKERGGENFYIVGEVCARYHGRWSEGVPAISPSFYTWKETENWATGDMATNAASSEAHFTRYQSDFTPPVNGTPNHKLDGNNYHTPDWSLRSGMDQIDFGMHWAFKDAHSAFNVAMSYDDDYNDATWNMTYVDSHDYAPDTSPENQRFAGSQETWAENLSLMFTFRGIPTLYYGSEIEFKKGKVIDVGPNAPLDETGRAYFGDHLEGSVVASDFGEYTASGEVANTLNYPLAQHIIALNKLRRAVPALQKGQYSTDGVSGGLAFKRRYTGEGVDSFVIVAISDGASFTNIPNGKYVDVVTGDVMQVSGGSANVSVSGRGNLRAYVLDLPSSPAPGKVSDQGPYLN